MRVIAAFFGPYAPEALTAYVAVFSRDFKRFEQLTKLATSSDGVGPVAMEYAGVKMFLCRQMANTGHKRLPERPIIGPFGKNFVDGRVMDGRFPVGVVRNG